jgi:hypothetical protein
MMRKLDEPLLSLELFDECQNLTSKKENICLEVTKKTEGERKTKLVLSFLVDQLREQNFIPLRKAFSRTNELQYRTIKFIFKHLHLYV